MKLKKYSTPIKERYKSHFKEAKLGSTNSVRAFELYRKLLQKKLKQPVFTSGMISDVVMKDGQKVGGVMFYIGNQGKKRIRMNLLLTTNSVEVISIDFWHKMNFNPDLTLKCNELNVLQLLDLIIETVDFGEPVQTQIFNEQLKDDNSIEKISEASETSLLILKWIDETKKTEYYLKNTKVAQMHRDFAAWNDKFGNKKSYNDMTFRTNLAKILSNEGLKNINSTLVTVAPAQKEIKVLTPEEEAFQKELEEMTIKEEDLKGSIKLLKTLVEGLGILTQGIVITGTPGIGKSYTTTDVLENVLGKKVKDDYLAFTGEMSPIEFFKILHDNRDKVLVFDDADAVIRDRAIIGMLKGALNTQGKREVSYNKSSITGKFDKEGEAVYDSPFEFSGQIIIISNLKAEDLDLLAPVMDRINHIHFNISQEDLLEYIEEILDLIYGHIPMKVKKEAFEFFRKFGPHYKSAQKKGISIRGYTKTLDLILSGLPEAAWKIVAKNTL